MRYCHSIDPRLAFPQFPPITNAASILEQVCEGAQRGLGLPIPYVITEMSLYTGVKSASFETEFYESQLATWAWSGGTIHSGNRALTSVLIATSNPSPGSMYWSYRLLPSQLQLQAGLDYSQVSQDMAESMRGTLNADAIHTPLQYSFVTLVNNGSATIPTPGDYNLRNTSTRANAVAFLSNLDSHCGNVPNNVAPFPAPTTEWTVEEEARAASAVYTATSAVSPSATSASRRNRMKRSFNA